MPMPFGRSILVLAPHPDDEVVGCCAMVGRALAEGARVHVIHLTHGCLDRDTVWPWRRSRHEAMVARRRAEGERAAAQLGVQCAGWSDRPARHLWRNLSQAEAEVRTAVETHAVDQLWTPAFEGGNPDHDGANALASRFAASGLSVLEFAEYNCAGGRARSHRFPSPTGAETEIRLTPAEQAAKRRAIRLYASERANLGSLGVERECFRPLAPCDYARPPHEGRLWYARFQWVPFPHPRVDFVQPEAVLRAITEFLAGDADGRGGALTKP